MIIAIRNHIETWSEKERQAWRSPEKLTVTELADKYRKMPERSAFPGQYKSSLTPYAVEIQNAFCDPEVEWVVNMAPAQSAKSTIEENMLGFAIDQDPGDCLIVVPRDADIPYVSQKRIKQMITDSPHLARHIIGGPRQLQGDTFKLDRMDIMFTASGSPAGLAERSVRYVIFREPDKYPPFAGREANPIALAVKRATTYWDRKFVISCTPTTEWGYTWVYWEKSNKNKYYIPCPRCGEYRIWVFENLHLPKQLRKPDEILAKKDVWYECEVCGHKIEEIEKPKLVASGLWLPEGMKMDSDGNTSGKPTQTKRISGYNYEALISPFMHWPEIMAAWFEANTEEGIMQGARMDFDNSIRGTIHKKLGKQLRAEDVKKNTGTFSRGTVPPDCILLVASADYHKSQRGVVRIDYEVAGFAIGMKNYVINTGFAASWKEYDEVIINSPYPWSDGTPNDKRPWLIVSCSFEDSKFEPDDVYEHCRVRPGFSLPIMGEQGPLNTPLRLTELEAAIEPNIRKRRHTRAWYRGMQLMHIDTHYFKNLVTAWAEPTVAEDPEEEGKLKVIAPPLMQTYAEIPSYFFTEFTNEKLVKVIDKRSVQYKYIWQPVFNGAQTHSLDLRVYAAAAGFYKGIQYLKPGAMKAATVKLSEIQRQKKEG
jgi:phage terminase large subunit GpA-like protein